MTYKRFSAQYPIKSPFWEFRWAFTCKRANSQPARSPHMFTFSWFRAHPPLASQHHSSCFFDTKTYVDLIKSKRQATEKLISELTLVYSFLWICFWHLCIVRVGNVQNYLVFSFSTIESNWTELNWIEWAYVVKKLGLNKHDRMSESNAGGEECEKMKCNEREREREWTRERVRGRRKKKQKRERYSDYKEQLTSFNEWANHRHVLHMPQSIQTFSSICERWEKKKWKNNFIIPTFFICT